MIAALELGGTKTVVAVGSADGALTEEWRFETTSPEETFARAADWLRERGEPESIGIAAFGPVEVVSGRERSGCMLATPKDGWSGFPIVATLAESFPEARITIETDVNAAALAEQRLGAGRGIEDLVYITIGTGIGAGILNGGHLLHGWPHPEFGHLKTPRAPGDADFPGVCPFHGDCLEGMASGPAMKKRHGREAADLPPDHPAWDIEAWYLAHGVLALLAIASPARVVLGGGVSQAEGFHSKVNRLLAKLAAGYFPALEREGDFVVPPELGQEAGIRGALLLAGRGD